MRIAIITDSHDNLANLKKTLAYLNRQGIKLIIHCGDIASDETLEKMVKFFPGNIYFTFGNADNIPLAKIKNSPCTKPKVLVQGQKSPKESDLKSDPTGQAKLNFCNKFGEIEIDNKKIAFTHFPSQAKKLAKKGKYDLVFYGHTHKPWIQQISNLRKSTLLVNPGNLCGVFYKPSFAVYDTEKQGLSLIRLDLI